MLKTKIEVIDLKIKKIRLEDLQQVVDNLMESDSKGGLWSKEIISIQNAIKWIRKHC